MSYNMFTHVFDEMQRVFFDEEVQCHYEVGSYGLFYSINLAFDSIRLL